MYKRQPADSSVYPTISAALDAIPMDLNEPACIYLAPGIYHEKITINKQYQPWEQGRNHHKSGRHLYLTCQCRGSSDMVYCCLLYTSVTEAQKRNIYTPYDLTELEHDEYEEKWNGFCDAYFAQGDE